MSDFRRARHAFAASLSLVLLVGLCAVAPVEAGSLRQEAVQRTAGAPLSQLDLARSAAGYEPGESLRSGLLTGRPVVVPDADPASPLGRSGRTTVTTPRPDPKTESTIATASTAPSAPSGRAGAGATAHHGRNHVWFPALRIDRSTTFFSCSSTAYPGNRVYRWGCAGRNNVYLFGHAYSVFKPLHDAYVRGSLRKGMTLYYADGQGRVGTYKVAWWKVVRPDRGEFAYAAQSRPSVTLQTCVGATSQYRLVVRLYRAG
jgi:hypothetical protein